MTLLLSLAEYAFIIALASVIYFAFRFIYPITFELSFLLSFAFYVVTIIQTVEARRERANKPRWLDEISRRL